MKFLPLFTGIILIALLPTACVSPAGGKQRVDLLGAPSTPSAATRTIVIHDNTKYVNVTGGEIVRFIVGDRAFAWNFDSAQDLAPFSLTVIAPPDVTFARDVTVYVAPNPLYVRHRGPLWSPWPP
ncbi:MAG: CzcE family metal-binding protein [Burkholderiaceae bacterium]